MGIEPRSNELLAESLTDSAIWAGPGKPDITADSAAVNESHYTGDQWTFVPHHPGEGWRGERKETVT